MTQKFLPAPSPKPNSLKKLKQKIITNSAYHTLKSLYIAYINFLNYQNNQLAKLSAFVPQPIQNYFLNSRFDNNKQVFSFRNKARYLFAIALDLVCLNLVVVNSIQPAQNLISPIIHPLKPLTESKASYEVFGFAPFWTFDRLDNVDFKVLTTFAYFGVDIDGNGNLDKEGRGYQTFKSEQATRIFKKAHDNGTRVVLTLTQMRNGPILALMDSPQAQQNAISQIVHEVKSRGIDGVNVDFEYTGNPGQDYRDKFSNFVRGLTEELHKELPYSQVTVSVYASAVRDPKIYDIKALGGITDGVFMMAYDFAVAGSDNAIPTAPLYGHKEGKYWYDIATAVDDFTKHMPANKLILGVPYYGYNYLVYSPTVKAETRPSYTWRGRPVTQTYQAAVDSLKPDAIGVDEFKTGWDDHGKVGYIAYHVTATDTWRMIFLEDTRSLGIKYEFAKNKNLAGVGMWALGFDNGKRELWELLSQTFGHKAVAYNIKK
jgi:spore germination protein YaaH